MIHGHGGDSYLFDVKYDFSSNVIPKEFNIKLLRIIEDIKFDFTRYPEPDASTLSKLFEKRFQLPENSTIALNGSIEGIYLWAEFLKNTRFLIPVPSFSEYEDAAKRFSKDILFCNYNNLSENITYVDSIILCNPNNPDGTLIPKDFILSLVKKYRTKNFLIDEAYIDIAGDKHSLLNHIKDNKNLFILRSMTKLFTLPGVRLGFLSFHPENYEKIISYKFPWSVNSAALRIGKLILQRYDELLPDLTEYRATIKKFHEMLSKVPNLEVKSSTTNYFLCKSTVKSSILKQILLEKYRILIRDASNFKTLTDYHIRISAQTDEANSKLVEALCLSI